MSSIGSSTTPAPPVNTELPPENHTVEEPASVGNGGNGEPVLVAGLGGMGFSPRVAAPSYSPSPTQGSESSGSFGATPETVEPASSVTTEETSTVAPTGTTTTTQSAAPAGGTNIVNNLAGRDPDLIHTGETIKLANGKTHVVKAGETLGGIAAANGMKLDDLIKANGMNASLLGKNSSGAYFSVGSAQPAPGNALVPAPKVVAPTVPTNSNQQTQPDLLPKGDRLAVLRDFLKTEATGNTASRLKAIEDRIANPDAELSDLDHAVLLAIENDYKSKHPEPVAPQKVVAPSTAEPTSTPSASPTSRPPVIA
jgi:LysM repeat protein